MKKTALTICKFSLVLLILAVALKPAVSQDNSKDKGTKVAPRHVGASTAAGLFTGALEGKIRIAGQNVLVTKNTTIYVPGQRPSKKQQRTYVGAGSSIYAAGKMQKGTIVADIVVVSKNKLHGEAKILDESYATPPPGHEAQ